MDQNLTHLWRPKTSETTWDIPKLLCHWRIKGFNEKLSGPSHKWYKRLTAEETAFDERSRDAKHCTSILVSMESQCIALNLDTSRINKSDCTGLLLCHNPRLLVSLTVALHFLSVLEFWTWLVPVAQHFRPWVATSTSKHGELLAICRLLLILHLVISQSTPAPRHTRRYITNVESNMPLPKKMRLGRWKLGCAWLRFSISLYEHSLQVGDTPICWANLNQHWSGPRAQQRSILAHCREVLSGPQKIHTFQGLEMGWNGQLLLMCIKWIEFQSTGTVSMKQMKVWTSMPWESRRERKTSSNSVTLSSHFFCWLSNFQGCHGPASKPPRWEASSAASTKSEAPETTWESAIIGTIYEALGLKHLVNHPKWPLAIGGWIISPPQIYIYIYIGVASKSFSGASCLRCPHVRLCWEDSKRQMNCPQTLDELLLGSPTVFCGFSGSLVSGLSDGQFLGLDQLRFPGDW